MDFRERLKILARKVPDPLRRRVKRILVPDAFIRWMYDGSSGPALALDSKLWGGFSRYALKDLEALQRNAEQNPKEALYASWAIARWHAANGAFEAACESLARMRHIDPAKKWDMGSVLVEADSLIHLGEREAARACLQNMLQKQPNDVNLYLAMANTYAPLDGPGDEASDAIRLSWINRVYERAGLLPIAKADPARPLGFDNLAVTLPQPTEASDSGPKVTVIMPVFKAETTLPVALRGLLAQTWRNLEIVVVDDHSPDNSFAVAETFARADPRVRAIRQTENQGAYVARNCGLKYATGDLITVHDADDWSHPQKIEMQVTDLRGREAVGSMTAWIRVRPNLYVNPNWKPDHRLIRWNHSSIMFHRAKLDEFGGWDPVRANADSEFMIRVEKKYGSRHLPRVGITIPWSFALQNDSSLTREAGTHITTTQFGVRHEHRRAFSRWHVAAAASGDFYLDPSAPAPRKFPAPASILPSAAPPVVYDVVFVGDLALSPRELAALRDDMRLVLGEGHRVGVFHWPRYDLDPVRPVDEEIAQLIDRFKIDMIVAGQKVTAKRTIVFDPVALQYQLDNPPAIVSGETYVVDSQDIGLSSGQVSVEKASATLSACFGSGGNWVSQSPLRKPRASRQPRTTADRTPVTFGISLASAAAGDFALTTRLLRGTLRSILGQTNPAFRVVICGHERPALPELDDGRIEFLRCDDPPPQQAGRLRSDKLRKRRIILAYLRDMDHIYFMPLDADDLINKNLVDHVMRDQNPFGYIIERGLAFDYASRAVAPVPGVWSASFDRVCGSSGIFRLRGEELPTLSALETGEAATVIMGSHSYWKIGMEELGRPLSVVPFAGAAYVVNHGSNLSFMVQRSSRRQKWITEMIRQRAVPLDSVLDDFPPLAGNDAEINRATVARHDAAHAAG